MDSFHNLNGRTKLVIYVCVCHLRFNLCGKLKSYFQLSNSQTKIIWTPSVQFRRKFLLIKQKLLETRLLCCFTWSVTVDCVILLLNHQYIYMNELDRKGAKMTFYLIKNRILSIGHIPRKRSSSQLKSFPNLILMVHWVNGHSSISHWTSERLWWRYFSICEEKST